MWRLLFAAAFSVLLASCGGSTQPGEIQVEGTFIGDYTAVPQPGLVWEGVLQLSQSGRNVTGTLTTSAGRSANVAGSVSGARLSLSGTYTDGCAGTVTSTADITNSGRRLVGNYSASDCVGQYTGGYVLDKQ